MRGGVRRSKKRPRQDGASLLQLHQQVTFSNRLSGLAVDALHLRGGERRRWSEEETRRPEEEEATRGGEGQRRRPEKIRETTRE